MAWAEVEVEDCVCAPSCGAAYARSRRSRPAPCRRRGRPRREPSAEYATSSSRLDRQNAVRRRGPLESKPQRLRRLAGLARSRRRRRPRESACSRVGQLVEQRLRGELTRARDIGLILRPSALHQSQRRKRDRDHEASPRIEIRMRCAPGRRARGWRSRTRCAAGSAVGPSAGRPRSASARRPSGPDRAGSSSDYARTPPTRPREREAGCAIAAHVRIGVEGLISSSSERSRIVALTEEEPVTSQ